MTISITAVTSKTDILKQTIFYILQLCRDHCHGKVLDVHGEPYNCTSALLLTDCSALSSPMYDGPTYPSWLNRLCALPWIDAIACHTDKRLSTAISSRSSSQSAIIDIAVGGTGSRINEGVAYALEGHPYLKNTFSNWPVVTTERSIRLP